MKFLDVKKSKVLSEEIVDSFLASGKERGKINVEETGRSDISVYNALLMYLKRHWELGVSVEMCEGEIVLVKNEETGTSAIIY